MPSGTWDAPTDHMVDGHYSKTDLKTDGMAMGSLIRPEKGGGGGNRDCDFLLVLHNVLKLSLSIRYCGKQSNILNIQLIF